jgi:hypothetical protein
MGIESLRLGCVPSARFVICYLDQIEAFFPHCFGALTLQQFSIEVAITQLWLAHAARRAREA